MLSNPNKATQIQNLLNSNRGSLSGQPRMTNSKFPCEQLFFLQDSSPCHGKNFPRENRENGAVGLPVS